MSNFLIKEATRSSGRNLHVVQLIQCKNLMFGVCYHFVTSECKDEFENCGLFIRHDSAMTKFREKCNEHKIKA